MRSFLVVVITCDNATFVYRLSEAVGGAKRIEYRVRSGTVQKTMCVVAVRKKADYVSTSVNANAFCKNSTRRVKDTKRTIVVDKTMRSGLIPKITGHSRGAVYCCGKGGEGSWHIKSGICAVTEDKSVGAKSIS